MKELERVKRGDVDYQIGPVRRLVAAIVLDAVKSARYGSGRALRWLSENDEADFYISSLGYDRDEFVKRVTRNIPLGIY
jgi:hypothetical protein